MIADATPAWPIVADGRDLGVLDQSYAAQVLAAYVPAE